MERTTSSILLVEDEAIIALSERMMLEQHGYLVTVAHSGESAIESLARSPDVDLILMDIDLGSGMDGTETAEAILAERDVPIVFLSSHTEPEVVEKTEGITSYGYIVKNSGETVLLASIRMAFRLFEAKQESREHERRIREASDQLEETARQADERFKLMFDRAPLGYQSLDADGRFVDVNEEWLATFGYTRDEVIGKWFGDMIRPESVEGFRERFATFKKNGRVHSEFPVRRKDGTWRDVVFDGRVLTDAAGSFKQTHCIIRDETDRKRAEPSSTSGEALQQKLVANISDVIVIIDANGINRYKSPNVERLFGWKPSELVGESVSENVHPDDKSAVATLFTELISTPGESGTLECRYRCRDGSYRWIEFSGTNMMADPDIRGILGSYRDTTPRKQAEDALHASIYELKKSQEAANVGNWVWHIADGRLDWSDQMYRIFGIDQERFSGNLADVIATSIHPDDRPAVEASNASVMSSGAPIPVEYRVIRPDGEQRVVWAEAGELEVDQDGNPRLLRGIVLDITERKRTEESLRKNESILAKSELLAGSGGWEWDVRSDVFTVSEGWQRIHGCRKGELPRDDLMHIAHPDDRPAIANALERAIRDRAPYTIEHRIIRQDTGETRTIRALGEVELDADGELTKVLGAALDVTEHNLKQESIARLVAEKDLLLKETHHRVKNSFLTVETLLNLQAGRASSPELATALSEAESRVMSMRVLYEKLLESDRSSHVGARHYIEDVAQSVLKAHESLRTGRLETQIEDLELQPKAVFPVGAIVAELVTNSLKYGRRDESSVSDSTIQVSLTRADTHLTLEIRDNGCGLPPGFDPERTGRFGLMLVRTMAEQLGGTFTIGSVPGGGTISTIAFPE